jgi:hypothetical protein
MEGSMCKNKKKKKERRRRKKERGERIPLRSYIWLDVNKQRPSSRRPLPLPTELIATIPTPLTSSSNSPSQMHTQVAAKKGSLPMPAPWCSTRRRLLTGSLTLLLVLMMLVAPVVTQVRDKDKDRGHACSMLEG